jgi:hypothetical protein
MGRPAASTASKIRVGANSPRAGTGNEFDRAREPNRGDQGNKSAKSGRSGFAAHAGRDPLSPALGMV